MTVTDISFLILLSFLMVRGASIGLLRTLIGPACFAAGTLAAFIWFKVTGNMFQALLIAILGPIVLGWITGFILDRTLWKNGHTPSGLLSRIAGAATHILWGGSMFLLAVVLAAIFPLENFKLGDIRDDVKASVTYRLCEAPLQNMNLLPRSAVQDPDAPEPTSEEELAELMADPRIQKILSDPEIQAAIESRNTMSLMSNPVILELAKDPALVAKLLKASAAMKATTAP